MNIERVSTPPPSIAAPRKSVWWTLAQDNPKKAKYEDKIYSNPPCPPPPPSPCAPLAYQVYFHRTAPGGCCDCGDEEAWADEGCCSRHKRPTGDQATADPLSSLPRDFQVKMRGGGGGVHTWGLGVYCVVYFGRFVVVLCFGGRCHDAGRCRGRCRGRCDAVRRYVHT